MSPPLTPRTGTAAFHLQGAHSDTREASRPGTATASVRGALDEKNEVYIKAVALEEADGDDEDLEKGLPPRPTNRMHTVKISLAIMLVILTQTLGVAKVPTPRQPAESRGRAPHH